MKAMGNADAVRLRRLKPSDYAWLLELYKDVRRLEWEFLPLNSDQKRALFQQQQTIQLNYYRANFVRPRFEIILLEDTPIGRLFTNRDGAGVRVLDIALLKIFRGRGIGTYIVEQLMDECRKLANPLHLCVEKINPARKLYAKLGFEIVTEEDFVLQMQWRPEQQPF